MAIPIAVGEAAVTIGSIVNITCTPKAVGQAAAAWPEEGFYVVVTAKSLSAAGASLPRCFDSIITSRQVQVIKKPDVTITLSDGAAESTKQVCNNESKVDLGYTVSSGASGADVNITAAAVRTSANGPLNNVECTLPADPGEHSNQCQLRGGVTSEQVRHNMSGIAHRGRTRMYH
jgi:hypothetical protein